MKKELELIGQKINDKWIIKEFLYSDDSTGGNFSLNYRAESIDKEKKSVFVKFADIDKALKIYRAEMGFAKVLEKVTKEHNYEADLTIYCRNRKMKRVVAPIDNGEIRHDSFLYELPYIVFEWADQGDSHSVISSHGSKSVKASWWLRTLHHAVVGAFQMHRSGVAHQDIKPSNVVFFKDSGAKIADLGRAVTKDNKSHNDIKNGDPNHSPPELFYVNYIPDWDSKYLAQDLYMLGSLAYWYFVRKSFINDTWFKLDFEFRPGYFKGTLEDVLPVLETIFTRQLQEFHRLLPVEIADDLTKTIQQLCHPDPMRRGHPKDIASNSRSQFTLERYISSFLRIAKKLEAHGK